MHDTYHPDEWNAFILERAEALRQSATREQQPEMHAWVEQLARRVRGRMAQTRTVARRVAGNAQA